MYDIDIEITPEISEAIKQEFIKRLDDNYYLVYTDYNDHFDNHGKTFQECLNDKCGDKFYEDIDTIFLDSEYEGAIYEIDQIKDRILSDESLSHLHSYIEEWLDIDDNKDSIRDMIQDRDKSTPVQDMLGRTEIRARATLYSNYDCLPHNYDMGNTYSYSEYVKDMIDVLSLNPALVKQSFIRHGINAVGRFPNLTHRNGKEAVSYDDFSQELLNQCCYGLLTFAGILPVQDLWEQNFQEITHITIPKDNYCGMYSDWNGGGSIMEMKLLRDLKIPVSFKRKTCYDKFMLLVDEPNTGMGYCINEVYGLISSWWNKELKLTFKHTN